MRPTSTCFALAGTPAPPSPLDVPPLDVPSPELPLLDAPLLDVLLVEAPLLELLDVLLPELPLLDALLLVLELVVEPSPGVSGSDEHAACVRRRATTDDETRAKGRDIGLRRALALDERASTTVHVGRSGWRAALGR